MRIKCQEERVFSFSVEPPLYLPFYNVWGANAYYRYDPFKLNPFTINCSSTSGSPVVLVGQGFFGFMNEAGGEFEYDGLGTLTVKCYPGQELYYNESCNPYEEWERYNSLVLDGFERVPAQPFWSELEYCTWVDQKHKAAKQGSKNMQLCITEQFVYDYMARVKKLGLPVGKLTIDDGWDTQYAEGGSRIYGNWEIDREKFPNMERLVKDMTREGFIPGLWFAPFTFTPDCELAKAHPELIGSTYISSSESGLKWVFIKPSPILEDYYRKIFSYYIGMGFRKLKLDMAYGNKRDMKELLKIMYRVVKEIDPAVEVECHIPDIFVSKYYDTLRINDVVYDAEGKWRGVTLEHYKVCKYSSGGMILNLDHLGANTAVPPVDFYLAQSRLILSLDGGYPCVSLLPDAFGEEAVKEYTDAFWQWHERNKSK